MKNIKINDLIAKVNIVDIIEKSMNDCKFIDNPSVDEILEREKEVSQTLHDNIGNIVDY